MSLLHMQQEELQKLVHRCDRFICVNPRLFAPFSREAATAAVCANFPHALPTAISPLFYALPHSTAIAQSPLHRNQAAIALEVSSGVAVLLLALRPTDHVAEVCCAPGAKLLLAALLVESRAAASNTLPAAWGSVTGVDVSQQRLSTCRSLVKRHKLQRVRLFCADGREFVRPPATSTEAAKNCDDKSASEAAAFYASAAYRKGTATLHSRLFETSGALYDKVLVDAECSHDASAKHLLKAAASAATDLQLFSPERIAALSQLQFALLCQGAKLLKPGGLLLYSTCSAMRTQNESVVERLLLAHEHSFDPIGNFVAHAEAEPFLEAEALAPYVTVHSFEEERLRERFGHTTAFLKFDAAMHRMGGLFVALFRKHAA